MDIYSIVDSIPLTFSRVRNNALVTGLTVTVSVLNAKTAASLLGSTAMTETSGLYTYNWVHGLTVDTECLITYTVGSTKYNEFILITNEAIGGHVAD